MLKIISKELLTIASIRVGAIVGTFLAMTLLSRQGMMDTWGEFVLFLTYTSLFGIVVQYGQGVYVLKQTGTSFSEFWEIQANSFFISLPFVLTGLALSYLIDDEVLVISLVITPLYSFMLNFQYHLQKEAGSKLIFSLLNANNYIYLFVFALILPLLYIQVINFEVIIGGLSFFLLVTVFAALVFVKNRKNRNISFVRNPRILRQSRVYVLISASYFLMSWTDTIVLDFFGSREDVGYYNVIFKIASLMTIVLSILNAVIAPKIADALKNGSVALAELVKPYNRVGLAVGVVSFLIILFGSDLLLTKVINVPTDKVTLLSMPLVIMGFGYLVNAACGNVGYLLQLSGLGRIFNKHLVVATLFNLILNLMLIPIYGIYGAALSSSFSMAYWNLMSVYSVKKKLKLLPI